MEEKCKHRRIKRNFPFGRNSKPFRSCKDCGAVISSRDMKNKKR